MTQEEVVNKAIEIEFGLGNVRSIREHNSSLVKIAEHVYDLLQPSLPSNLDDAVFMYEDSSEYPPANQEEEKMVYDAFKAGAEWMAGQGEIVLGNITRVADRLDVETLEYLPEESEFEIGDKVIVQIRKID